MRKLSRFLVAWVVAMALGLLVQPLAAQPSEDDHALGKELAIAGFDSYKAGSYEDALQSFQKASELYPTGQVLRMFGYTLLALERWIEAAEALEKALQSEFKPLPDELLGEVRANLDKALSHVATVDVDADVEGAIVSIDGGETMSLPVSGLRLAEGRHTFQATAEGQDDVEREVELAGGEKTTVSLSFAGEELPPPPPRQGVRRAEVSTSDGSAVRIVGMAAGGIGLLATGVGVATLLGGVAMDESAEDRKTVYAIQYTDGCPPEDQALCAYEAAQINNQVDRAATLQTTGVVLTVVGGTLLTAGILMVVLAPDGAPADDRDAAGARLACGPYGQAGLGCVGTF
jgi:hypothetical protein